MEIGAVKTRIKEIIAEVADLDPSEISDDAKYVEDLDLDSLALLELGVDIDYEFKLGVPDEELKAITSLPETLALIERYLKKKAASSEVA